MNFLDQIEVEIVSGHGGPGMVNFKAARSQAKLGPDGGNGGLGGDVVFRASQHLRTLSKLRQQHRFVAESGGKGEPNNRTGKNGAPCVIDVPIGTTVVRQDTKQVLGDLTEEGQTLIAARGGKRGYGNLHHVSSTNRAPRIRTQGEPGEEFRVKLELRVLADVGFVGFPNAGKSTLLSTMSSAKPKIADYPFTTLVPELGVVDISNHGAFGETMVFADLPGLVTGAHRGRGLGLRFLRHIGRTQALAMVLDGVEYLGHPDFDQLKTLRHELTLYSEALAQKPYFVVMNKNDLFDEETRDQVRALYGDDVVFVSGVTGEGIEHLKSRAYQIIR